ncbi:MAG TPA: M20/M25/M40 family metallo-hydrolase [Thermoanaerobaculia bacterium]|jgi:acetylornithine deacetylase|nr:M20/M25/M40 family metallo-hydrolase [Thermoanaerobaculia bacterium]
MIDPIALARQLIDIPSTTGDEAPHADFLERELRRLGFQARRQAVTETRFNLFASAGGRPRVVINSHLDTVPPWFESREDDTYVYGRGACDTKGVIAAMVAAGEKLLANDVRDFAFLFVVGEETDSIGAKSANAAFRDLGSEYVIVGEPTGSKFARASKGALTCVVRFDGVAAHSAYPHLGDSAINKMVKAIAEINATEWGRDENLGETTVNVGVVRGGEKPNIIAAKAECEMIFRLVTSPEDIRARLEPILAKNGGTITWTHGNPPQHMVVPDGAESVVVAFNTDVPHLRALGKPLLFGPGSILDAHGANEKIGKRELLEAVDIYYKTVAGLLS